MATRLGHAVDTPSCRLHVAPALPRRPQRFSPRGAARPPGARQRGWWCARILMHDDSPNHVETGAVGSACTPLFSEGRCGAVYGARAVRPGILEHEIPGGAENCDLGSLGVLV